MKMIETTAVQPNMIIQAGTHGPRVRVDRITGPWQHWGGYPVITYHGVDADHPDVLAEVIVNVDTTILTY